MEKIFSIAELKANSLKVADCIVIPDWILDKILGLCRMEVEYSGQLLCYDEIVEYPFLTGSGTIGSVFPNKKVILTSPNFTTIEFHTHTSVLGDFWSSNFSDGDLTTFNNRILQEGKRYQHILFTTKNVLTWGKYFAPDVRIGFGNTKIVMETFYKINNKHKCW